MRMNNLTSTSVGVGSLALGLMTWLGSAGDLSAAESEVWPRRLVVPKLCGSIKLDGHLDEPAWTNAAFLAPFNRNEEGLPAREQTEVRLWYDDQALYLGWKCEDSDIVATFTNRDSKFWEEEVAEFFVTPKNLNQYFELQWNPLGGVFDAKIDNDLDEKGVSRAFHGDWSYTASSMRWAVTSDSGVNASTNAAGNWQVEVRLPFADLGRGRPRPREVWRANFYRVNRSRNHPVELLSWSPTRLPGFHQPNRFGYLEFRE